MDNWDSIEVNVRSLVKRLIEPTIIRVLENKEKIENLYKETSSHNTRLEDQNQRIDTTITKISIIDKFSRRLMDFSSTLKGLEFRLEKERIYNKSSIDEITLSFTKINEKVELLERQREQLRGEIAQNAHSIVQNRGFIDDKLFEFQNIQTERNNKFNSSLELMNKRIDHFSSMLSEFNLDIGKVDLMAQQAIKDSLQNKTALKTLTKDFKSFQKTAEKAIEINRVTESKDYLELKQTIDEVKEFATIEFPLQFNLNNFEVLFKTITATLGKKRVAEAQLEFLSLYDHVHLPTHLETPVQAAKDLCLKVLGPTRKNARRINTTAVKKPDPEQIQTSAIEDSEHDEYDQLRLMIIDLQKNLEDFKDLTSKEIDHIYKSKEEDLEILHETVSKEISLVKTDLNLRIDQFQDELSENLNKTKQLSEGVSVQEKSVQAIKQKFEEFYKEFLSRCGHYDNSFNELNTKLNLLDDEFKALSGKRRKEISDINNEFKTVNGELDTLNDKIRDMNYNIGKLKSSDKTILDALQIQALLDFYDENDRESLTLTGYNENPKNTSPKSKPKPKKNRPQSVISLDKKCISCTNPSAVTVNAFKMACLTYNPSQISYKNATFSRMELIEAKKLLLERFNHEGVNEILNSIKSQRPCTTVPLSTRRRTSSSPLSITAPFFVNTSEDLPKLRRSLFRQS